MAFAIRDILEAQIAYLRNTRPFRSYTPIAVATRLRGYVRRIHGRFEAITPRVAT